MNQEEIIPLAVPATYLLLLSIEHRFAGRDFPKVRGWKLTGLLLFAAIGGQVLPRGIYQNDHYRT